MASTVALQSQASEPISRTRHLKEDRFPGPRHFPRREAESCYDSETPARARSIGGRDLTRKCVGPFAVALFLLSSASTAAEEALTYPRLPEEPIRYADKNPPKHLLAALRGTDNTPADNPLTDAGALLGRVLFYDKRLSKSNTIACASCHLQSNAFSDPRQFSLGFDGRPTKRNAMSLTNARYSGLHGNWPGFFWDERAPTLEAQVLMPIQDPVEMGLSLAELEQKLGEVPYYPPLFDAAFGSRTVSADRISKAVAQFMRAMLSFNSKFDRASASSPDDYSVDFDSFTAEENLGKSLFIDGVGRIAEIGCAHCHMPPTFGMPKSFNTGLELEYVDQGLGSRDVPSNDPFTDNNDGKFKAPPLRNIALTAPYMHDGRFKTLEEVVEHYSSGVHPHRNVAIAFDEAQSGGNQTAGFNLTEKEKMAIVAFLKTLTDDSFVSDQRFSDPFTD